MTGVTRPPRAAGVDGRTILTAATQPVRPPSLLAAESVRLVRRVNAHQGQIAGYLRFQPRSRLAVRDDDSFHYPVRRAAGATRSRGDRGALTTVSLADGGDARARRHRRRPLRQSDNPVTPGPPPAAGIALVAGVETVPTPL